VDASLTELLRRTEIFAGLDEASLQSLADRCRRRTFPSGTALFHEGDPGHTLYVVVSGSVSIQRVTAGGEMVHLAQRGPGESVGELSLLDGKPRMADAITAGPTTLLMLDRGDFLRSLEEKPALASQVIACLADRLREAAGHLEGHQSRDVLGRVSAALLQFMESGGVEEQDGEWRLAATVTQRQLGDRVASTRESVNRALARLKQVRAIRMEGRQLVVLDPKKLRRYCEE
jgi:CRP-like cAMP-binding protein